MTASGLRRDSGDLESGQRGPKTTTVPVALPATELEDDDLLSALVFEHLSLDAGALDRGRAEGEREGGRPEACLQVLRQGPVLSGVGAAPDGPDVPSGKSKPGSADERGCGG